MDPVEFDSIRHPITDAFAMQRLTLQDLTAGEYPDAKEIANPFNPKLLLRQVKKNKNQPENYFISYVNGRAEGYLKTGLWTVGYEKNFATEEELEYLKHLRSSELTSELKLAIYGLVTSDKYSAVSRASITEVFLDEAIERGTRIGAKAVNIILHKNDPVRLVAEDRGFEFTGRTGRADNVENIVQDLYSIPLAYPKD